MTAAEGCYYLGIDIGTQGLSVLLTDSDLHVVATGEGTYGFSLDDDGCYEQVVQDWEAALQSAMTQLHEKVSFENVLAIGISGQMHGEVLADANGTVLGPVRLWCDARNENEGHELTNMFQTKVPKRATAARFLWTCRNLTDMAQQVRHVTTPAGWLAYRLTGEWNLGIGDAAGMFPIDNNKNNKNDNNNATLRYNANLLEMFDQLVSNASIPSLASLLPAVKKAGEHAGYLNESGAALLGLLFLTDHQDGSTTTTTTGNKRTPVAAAEGDQVAALAGSLIGRPGMVSCSFGTSVCANIVGDADSKPFVGVSSAVDHFCSADGKPIHMIWLRNGTTFLNTLVQSYGSFGSVMPQLLRAPPDCQGLIALPFMDDEPGLQVSKGGSACILGYTADNATAGNVAKAALLATMFNLKLGCRVLDEQGFPRSEIILSGGLTKTPECGQILADVFNTPVTLLASAEEGCSWGAAVLAKFRHLHHKEDHDGTSTFVASSKSLKDWPDFLESIAAEQEHQQHRQRFEPNPMDVPKYEQVFEKYKALIELQPLLTNVVQSK